MKSVPAEAWPELDEPECDWCGTVLDTVPGPVFRDRIGGKFCSRSHRDQSTAAVRHLRRRDEKDGGEVAVPAAGLEPAACRLGDGRSSD